MPGSPGGDTTVNAVNINNKIRQAKNESKDFLGRSMIN